MEKEEEESNTPVKTRSNQALIITKIDQMVKDETEAMLQPKRIPVVKMNKHEPSNDKSSTGIIVEEDSQ